MARSSIETLMPLDEYARIMAIPGWVFNQVVHPERPYHGGCSDPVFQSGYRIDPTQFMGRDEIAQAISTAERQIAGYLGYWPAPKWICADEVEWPKPKRGVQLTSPYMKTTWGNILDVGVRLTELNAPNQEVVYSDEDGDGTLDTGTITIDGIYAEDFEHECEVVVVPVDYDTSYRIRMLDIDIGDQVVITGPRWLFVDPEAWLNPDGIPMEDDTAFLDYVDVYRRRTDPSHQARIIWRNGDLCEDEVCGFEAQNACISVKSARSGIVSVAPGTYSGGAWSRASYARCSTPTHVRLWYQSGYVDDACQDCSMMGPTMKEAIVRLANVYLPANPCGCDISMDKWRDDREELRVGSYAVALAQRRLGTTARGAVFAMSVISSLEPLGRGG